MALRASLDSDGEESACNAGDPGLIPGSGSSLGEGNGNTLQYSCLGNHMDEEPGRLHFMGSQWTCGIWAASCPGVSMNFGASQRLLEGDRGTVRTLLSHSLLFLPWGFSAWTLNTASFCDSLIHSPDLARESGKTQAWMSQ